MWERVRWPLIDGSSSRSWAVGRASALGLALLAGAAGTALTAAPASAETGRLGFKPAPAETPAQVKSPTPSRSAAAGTSAASASPATPSKATVLEVQRLFIKLGYPLGPKALGGFGPRTKGALSYFQRKYGLPVTGLADPRTIALMRKVAASLSAGTAGGSQAPPKDLVERVFGDHLPLLGLAVGLAALLALLALSARQRPV